MERSILTPGKLYARLSAEFRRRCEHPNCRMPMVMLAHRVTPEGPNWTLEPSLATCEACMRLVEDIVQEAENEFDLRDPTALPRWPGAATRTSHQPAMRR